PEEQSRLSKARPVKKEAMESYWRGRILGYKPNNADNLAAIESFQHAVDLEENFAEGYAALAIACVQRFYGFVPEEHERWEQTAFVATQRAIELDPDLAEAYVARGWLLWTPGKNFAHEDAV